MVCNPFRTAADRQKNKPDGAVIFETVLDGLAFVEAVVSPTATVHAGEASHWDAQHATYVTKRINHSEAYSWDGACTNQAESFLARLRRMVMGQHHHVSPNISISSPTKRLGKRISSAFDLAN